MPTRISIPQAAQRWGVHPTTIRRRIADGSLTAYRSGKRLIRLDAGDVDALFEAVPTTGRRSA